MTLSELKLKQTDLYKDHIALKAKMVSFNGWEMPLQYEGIFSEYNNTRHRVTMFDTSHMGIFIIQGDVVTTGLNQIIPQPIHDMPIKTCHYGMLLNEQGGVVDDLLIYRITAEKWMLVVNAGTIDKDERYFQAHLLNPQDFHNLSEDICKVDVQGPLSRQTLSMMIKDLDKLNYYQFDEFELLGEKAIVSRTGYTGELGYEIYFPCVRVSELWAELKKLNIKPAGLGVRDVLRIEMGYCLYGHELSEELSPLQAGLGCFIDWDKDFIGKDALLEIKERGLPRKLIAFVSDSRRSPRPGYKIFSQEDKEIGIVTSGTFSPSLKKGIGLAFINSEHSQPGEKIKINIAPHQFFATIEKKPIYKESTCKH